MWSHIIYLIILKKFKIIYILLLKKNKNKNYLTSFNNTIIKYNCFIKNKF